jgi:hypothetical protein
MKCLKLLLGISLAASLHVASPGALAQGGGEKALTTYIGCLLDPLENVPGVPAYQLVAANLIGFDRVVVWRHACLDNPTKSAILIRVFPHYPDMTLLTGSLISAIQNGNNVGPFNLLQTTRDVDGYTGYLDQPRTFILAQTNTLPRLLEENDSFKLLFMTGGAAASLDIPSKASTLPVYGYAIEYYNTGTGHYFITADPGEADLIDRGAAGPNWQRTGLNFKVWATPAGGGLPVCRFYAPAGIGPNTHFFSAFPPECAQTANEPVWIFEGVAFYATYPYQDGINVCPANAQYLYRLYNNRFAQNDSNHRYVTDYAVAESMMASGWAYEGPAMCVPR